MSMCQCMWVQVPNEARRSQVLWSWNYRHLWAAQRGHFGYGPLQEQYMLLTIEPSLQPRRMFLIECWAQWRNTNSLSLIFATNIYCSIFQFLNLLFWSLGNLIWQIVKSIKLFFLKTVSIAFMYRKFLIQLPGSNHKYTKIYILLCLHNVTF